MRDAETTRIISAYRRFLRVWEGRSVMDIMLGSHCMYFSWVVYTTALGAAVLISIERWHLGDSCQ